MSLKVSKHWKKREEIFQGLEKPLKPSVFAVKI